MGARAMLRTWLAAVLLLEGATLGAAAWQPAVSCRVATRASSARLSLMEPLHALINANYEYTVNVASGEVMYLPPRAPNHHSVFHPTLLWLQSLEKLFQPLWQGDPFSAPRPPATPRNPIRERSHVWRRKLACMPPRHPHISS